jgi:hypothetical protein
VAAVQAMIRKLGLERMLQGGTGVDKRVRNLIEAMIIRSVSRSTSSSVVSSFHTWRWSATAA